MTVIEPAFAPNPERECGEHTRVNPTTMYCVSCEDWCTVATPCKGCLVGPHVVNTHYQLALDHFLTKFGRVYDTEACLIASMGFMAGWEAHHRPVTKP